MAERDENRYKEILPFAYMTAALQKGGKPSAFAVGMCARDIMDAEDMQNPTYRVAMATAIPCEIISVSREKAKFGADYFHITYRRLGKNPEVQEINTRPLSDYRFGHMTEGIWGRYNNDGTNYWIGKRMTIYKHNDPPKEGDRSQMGYRCAVYAEPLDQ